MSEFIGLGSILIGLGLIASRGLSAELHERWNRRWRWTRWATGPNAMRASKVANVVVGVGLIAYGLAWLLGLLRFGA